MLRNFAALSLVLSAVFVPQLQASEATFYSKPAAWLFDLVKTPTSTRNFSLYSRDQKIGCTQISLGENIECTIHGTTEAFPKASSEAQTALCSINEAKMKVIFSGGDRGSITFDGEAAKSIFEVLPTTDRTHHSAYSKMTQTMKSYLSPGLDGMMCFENVPDDKTQPATYSCSISWR